jgi:hypothetical protein
MACRHFSGDFMQRNHRRCSLYTSAHQPSELQRLGAHHPVLLVHTNLKLQVQVCGIPGCRQLLSKGEQSWHYKHASVCTGISYNLISHQQMA